MSASSRRSDLSARARGTSILRVALLSTSAALLAALSLPGHAADDAVPLKDLVACAELDAAGDRLACFESLIEAARPAVSATPIETAPAELAVESAEPGASTAAGVEQPASPERGKATTFGLPRPNQETPPRSMDLTVERVERDSRDRMIFHMQDGSVWRQTKFEYLSHPGKEAFAVEISRGMMGDYHLRVNGRGRMTRVERIQ
jgi:hypothetical protein